MANLISLQTRQVFLSAGEPAAYAQAYFRVNNTDTQVAVYSDADLLSERSQPVEADADGVLPPCYIAGADAIRILLTDEDDVPLPGYPMDDVTPVPIGSGSASATSFSPTDDVPETNVQDAIELVAGLFTDQTALNARPVTPYATGGTGNAYTLTPSPAITAYAAGQTFLVRPDRANTAAATLNINGLGAREIRKVGTAGTPIAVGAGEIQPGREFMAYDDGTYLLMVLGRDFPTRGTGSNGSYTRFPDGTQVCWIPVLSLTFAATDSCAGDWTFPVAFSSASSLVVIPVLTGSTVSANSTAITAGATASSIGRADISAIAVGPRATTVATIRVFRHTGGTNFASGDVMYAAVAAVGRWF